LKIFVINLPESAERRQASAAELDKFAVGYEFFAACRGDKGPEAFFDTFDEDSYLMSTRRLPSAAEIGCYASHMKLWERCVELNEPIIILEDDFRLEANFADALSVADEHISKFGFLRLHPLVLRPRPGSRRLDKRVKILETAGFRISFLGKVPTYTLSYAVSPKAAAAFIATSKTLTAPVDKFLQQVWVHQQPIFALEPPCVMEAATASDSTIGDRSVKQKMGLGLKTRRQLNRLGAIAKRYFFRRKKLPAFISIQRD